MYLFFHHFWMIHFPFVVFQILCRRDLMNTILHKKIFEDCCYILAILIEKVKLFWYMLCFCDDLTLITWNLYYELWYKRKRKEQGKSFSIIVLGSIIQSGENVNLSPFFYSLCFPPILLIILDSLTPEPKPLQFPLYPLILRLFIG